jgi:hypothetical protein
MEKPKSEVRKVFEKFPVHEKKYSELKTFSEKKKFVENTKKGLEKIEKDKKAREAAKIVISKLNARLALETKKKAKAEWKKKQEVKSTEVEKMVSKTMNTTLSASEAKKLIGRKIPMEMKDGTIFMYDTEKSREENRKDMLELYGKI